MAIRILSALLAVFLISCGSDTKTPNVSQPQWTVIEQRLSDQTTAKMMTITSQAEWASTWAQLHPTKALPVVDFAKDTVVGIFLGLAPSPCYSVTIDSVVRGTTTTTVNYRRVAPAPNTACTQVLSYPSVIATIPKSDLPIEFQYVPAWTLIKQDDSAFTSSKQVAITSQVEWAALWSQLGSTEPLPVVNFTESTVVCIALGQRPDPCHPVTIDSVIRSTEATTVRYREVTPDPNTACIHVISYPTLIATIPKSDAPIAFQAMP